MYERDNTWQIRPDTNDTPGTEAAADQSEAMTGQEPFPIQRPSQAEGDRETVDEALREHEESGELF